MLDFQFVLAVGKPVSKYKLTVSIIIPTIATKGETENPIKNNGLQSHENLLSSPNGDCCLKVVGNNTRLFRSCQR